MLVKACGTSTGRQHRHPGAFPPSQAPLRPLHGAVPRLLSQNRQVGEAPQFPGVPGNIPSSAVKSDKSSVLRESPQGLKSVFALPCADRLEYMGPILSPQGEGAGQGSRPRQRQVYISPVSPGPEQSREETDVRGDKEGGLLGTLWLLCTKRFLT